jgi:hypothetical protein
VVGLVKFMTSFMTEYSNFGTKSESINDAYSSSRSSLTDQIRPPKHFPRHWVAIIRFLER